MQIDTTREALYVACEMERGAVQLYERALLELERLGHENDAVGDVLRAMLADEKGHLKQFEEAYIPIDAETERQLVLSAVAIGVLFDGGLAGIERAGYLDAAESILKFAEEAEAKAVTFYSSMADKSDNPQVKRMLCRIADEERTHEASLHAQRMALRAF
jgi:Uncharacterized conserved protein